MMLQTTDFFPNAYVIYDEFGLSSATYFELRPVLDGEYTCTGYLYGDESNFIQIRMGQTGRPSRLIAKYRFGFASQACHEFVKLAQFEKSLWYNGNDILVQITGVVDMVTQIAHQRFVMSDPEMEQLLENVGLDDNDRASVVANLT